MTDKISLTILKAKECLDDAAAMINMKRTNAAISRSYYAMFHSAQAVLLTENVIAFTHQGVNVQFNKYFIKKGIFEKEITTAYNKILDQRFKSDYEIGFNANTEDAAFAYEQALNFYNTIKHFLITNKFIV